MPPLDLITAGTRLRCWLPGQAHSRPCRGGLRRGLWSALGAALLSTGLLSACGGGGGDSIITPTSSVSTGSSSGSTVQPDSAATRLSGTVAVGQVISGAQVRARCVGGTEAGPVSSDAQGQYTLALGSALPPCLLVASGGQVVASGAAAGSGTAQADALYGIALSTGRANLTPLSTLALARVLGAAPDAAWPAFDGRNAPTLAQLEAAMAYVGNQLGALGIAAPGVSLFSGALALGDAHDLILDALAQATRSNASSLTELVSTATSGGSWSAQLAQARAAADAAAARAAEEARRANAAISGSASIGAPLVGAAVALQCSSGTPASGQSTDSSGQFSVRLQGAVPPCLVRVSGGTLGSGGASNSTPLHGLATEVGSIQVSPLSELVLAWALGSEPATLWAAGQGGSTSATAGTLASAKLWLGTQLAALGLASPAADPVSGAGAPNDANAQLAQALLARIDTLGYSLADSVSWASTRADLASQLLADRNVAVPFAAVAGNTALRCGQTTPPLGSTAAVGKVMDFRFYVSEATLLRADGVAVPIRLPANDDWRYTAANGDAVTLIDLEDGSADCAAEGSTGTNAWLRGTVPAGRYRGLSFTLGVPTSLNHSNTISAPAPLDSEAMSWSWQAGRKFAKIEITEPTLRAWRSSTFYVHLGSTGCTGNPLLGTVSCTTPNRGAVRLEGFDPATQQVLVDVAALLAGTNITINQGGAGGCMSAATDADCLNVMAALAIDWRSNGSGSGRPLDAGSGQTVFRAAAR